MAVITDDRIVIDNSAGVEDAVFADTSIRIDDHAVNDHRAGANVAWRDT